MALAAAYRGLAKAKTQEAMLAATAAVLKAKRAVLDAEPASEPYRLPGCLEGVTTALDRYERELAALRAATTTQSRRDRQ